VLSMSHPAAPIKAPEDISPPSRRLNPNISAIVVPLAKYYIICTT
jgi:hypothetical protein